MTPGETGPVVTGILATKGTEEPSEEWTVEELKSGKPLLVYYFVETSDPQDENYKFSRSLEQSVFGSDKVIEAINADWRAKKVALSVDDADDPKELKNQARIEFWSFTNVKLGEITQKNDGQLNPGPFRAALKKHNAKNGTLCKKEIQRLEDLAKREAAEEQASAK